MNLRRPARIALSIVVTVGLLVLVARKVDLNASFDLLTSARPGWVAIAICLVPLQIGLAGLRWRASLQGAGGHVTIPRAVGEVGLSTVLNQVLPGGLAGDAVRVWRERQGGLDIPIQAAVVDRWIGLWVHVAVTFFASTALWMAGGAPLREALVVAVVWTALTGLALWPGTRGTRVRAGLKATGPSLLVLSATLTSSFLVAFGICGLALGQPLGLWMLALPLVLLAMALPLSIGGWGLREAAAVTMLPRFGWTVEAALAVSSLYGLCTLIGSVPGLLAVRSRPETP